MYCSVERDLSPLVGKGPREETLAPWATLQGLFESPLLEGRKTASMGHMDVQTRVTVKNATEEEMGHRQAFIHSKAKNDVEIPRVKEGVSTAVARARLGVQDNGNSQAFMLGPQLFKLWMRQGSTVDVGADV